MPLQILWVGARGAKASMAQVGSWSAGKGEGPRLPARSTAARSINGLGPTDQLMASWSVAG
jgi:hypothetical protein